MFLFNFLRFFYEAKMSQKPSRLRSGCPYLEEYLEACWQYQRRKTNENRKLMLLAKDEWEARCLQSFARDKIS